MEIQKKHLPFGCISPSISKFQRIFSSPGPIYDPQGMDDDYWRINANNANVDHFASTSFTVNPDSIANVDVIVNSDNNVAINMDASTDSLTFGVPITSSQDISSSGAITADTLAGKLNGGSF